MTMEQSERELRVAIAFELIQEVILDILEDSSRGVAVEEIAQRMGVLRGYYKADFVRFQCERLASAGKVVALSRTGSIPWGYALR